MSTLGLVKDENPVIEEVHRNPGCSTSKSEAWQIIAIKFHFRRNVAGSLAYGMLFYVLPYGNRIGKVPHLKPALCHREAVFLSVVRRK